MTTEFDMLDGYLFPASDTECRRVGFREVETLDRLFPLVADWSACVQAGGNVGIWANKLAERFDAVYTFEPDADNFHCLARNVTAANVFKLQAALGASSEPPRDLERLAGNCGGHMLAGKGIIPVLPIDALNLPTCGLITLDIEGYELHAIHGAQRTIARCRPILLLEIKGISVRFGHTEQEVEARVLQLGYRVAGRLLRDTVFAPC